MPVAEDIISIRKQGGSKNIYSNPWIKVKVDEVRGTDIFFVSRWS